MSFIRGSRKMGGFPKPGAELVDDPGRHTRTGWVHVKDHESVTLNGKQYRHMREWRRPCAICGADFPAYEKSGTVDASSRFSSRTCDAHRGLMPAFEKGYIGWSKEAGQVVPGVRCGVGTPSAPAGDALNDTEMLEAELSGVYARLDAAKQEVAALKARLAKYELAPAIAEAAAPKVYKLPEPPLTMAESTARLNAMAAAAKNKMPWE